MYFPRAPIPLGKFLLSMTLWVFGFRLAYISPQNYLPTVIKVDVDVAYLSQTSGDQEICSLFDEILVDVAAEMVPAVPAHRWGESYSVVEAEGAQ